MAKQIIILLLLICFTAVGSAQKATHDIVEGNKAYTKGDYTNAAKSYNKALALEPNNEIAKYNLANTLMKQNNAPAAQAQYEALINATANPAIKGQAWYNQGLAAIQQKNTAEAVNCFKNALKYLPEDNDIRENLQKAMNELREQEQKKQQNNKNTQPQKPQPNQNKPQPDKRMMEQQFTQLRNQEKQLQKQLQKKNTMPQPEKDW